MMTKPTEILAKIVEMLTPLESEERRRIIQASMVLLGESSSQQSINSIDISETEPANLPTRARTWIKQSDLALDQLSQVFDFGEGNNVVVIAAEVPGKNNAERTVNAYVLSGISKLLATGDPSFDDKSARELCDTLGCYDYNNHSTYLKEKGNSFTGDKSKGWKLTAPGLKHGASLIKQLTKSQ